MSRKGKKSAGTATEVPGGDVAEQTDLETAISETNEESNVSETNELQHEPAPADPEYPEGFPYQPSPEVNTTYDRIIDALKQDAVNLGNPVPTFEKKGNQAHMSILIKAFNPLSEQMFLTLPPDVKTWYKEAALAYNAEEPIPYPQGYTEVEVKPRGNVDPVTGRVALRVKGGRKAGGAKTPREPKAPKVRAERPMGGVARVNEFVILNPHATREEVIAWAAEHAAENTGKPIKETVVTTYMSITQRIRKLFLKHGMLKDEFV